MNYNVFIENEFQNWDVDIDSIQTSIKKIFDYYMTCPEIVNNCCLQGYDYNSIAFDILFTDSQKTHQINKEYRNKDYPADIITFAVFADSPSDERFVLDLEINLGEIIIGLDKIIDESVKKEVTKETELTFMLSHGIMHLLGFDHQTQEEFDFVVEHQKQALESMGIKYDKI